MNGFISEDHAGRAAHTGKVPLDVKEGGNPESTRRSTGDQNQAPGLRSSGPDSPRIAAAANQQSAQHRFRRTTDGF